MKHVNNGRRGRSRNNNPKHRPSGKNTTFESNGPDVKVRGTAPQIVEKYLSLARDATSSGERIGAEAYYQYAEHYYRVMMADQASQPQNNQRQGRPDRPGDYDGGQGGSGDDNSTFSDNGDEMESDDGAQTVSYGAADPAETEQPDIPLPDAYRPPRNGGYDDQDQGGRGDQDQGRQESASSDSEGPSDGEEKPRRRRGRPRKVRDEQTELTLNADRNETVQAV
ncbi:MAG: DUF4167 domain-containing protein [Rhodospirillales bacterium]